jgi:adenylate cyclase
MNILFGSPTIDSLREDGRFTILELDIIQAAEDRAPETAYCILTDIGLGEINQLADKVDMHHQLIDAYRSQQWDACLAIMQLLYGSWNGEVDSFYIELAKRIAEYKLNPPPENWDGVLRPYLTQSY